MAGGVRYQRLPFPIYRKPTAHGRSAGPELALEGQTGSLRLALAAPGPADDRRDGKLAQAAGKVKSTGRGASPLAPSPQVNKPCAGRVVPGRNASGAMGACVFWCLVPCLPIPYISRRALCLWQIMWQAALRSGVLIVATDMRRGHRLGFHRLRFSAPIDVLLP